MTVENNMDGETQDFVDAKASDSNASTQKDATKPESSTDDKELDDLLDSMLI